MSKYGKLVKKVEAFERLAAAGDKKEFLKSLAQALPNGTVSFPDETVSDLLGRLGGSISNLTSRLKDPTALNLATQLAREVGSYRTQNYVSSKQELDQKSGEIMQFLAGVSTLLGLADKLNLDPDSKNLLNQAKQDASSIQTAVTSFYRNQNLPTVDPRDAATPAAAPKAEPAAAGKPAPKATDSTKAMAKSLIAIVNKLPEGPNRKQYLSVIDKGVRHLQNTFRSLQNSNGLQDYFAKMEITKALQHAYSQLDYDDLATVKSLEGGNGVPDSPDAKI